MKELIYLKITSVTVHKITGENSRMRGIATVVLDDCFKIKGIRIIEKDDKLMLAMPSRKNRNGENEDVAHPLNAETRQMFEDAVFAEYDKEDTE
jgi:stage V sporulation protein G